MEQEARYKSVKIDILEGVQVDIQGSSITIKGEKGEVQRNVHPQVKMEVKDNAVHMIAKVKGKKGKAIVGTWNAHVRNMMKGVKEGHVYTLKICSSHFPMTVTADKGKITVKNFMGEKVARETNIFEGVSVKVEGQDITIESANKELAGNMATALEKMTERVEYDRRIFQDGIYITSKDGKAIA